MPKLFDCTSRRDTPEDYAGKVIAGLRESLRMARLRNRNINRKYEEARKRLAELERQTP